MIYYTIIKSTIGQLGLVRNEKGLIKIYLPNEKISNDILKKDYPNNTIIEDKTGFESVINQLNEYFNGDRKEFNIKLDLQVSSFYKASLKEVFKVKYGTTASYSDIAKKLNNPKAVRAVGSANAKNPIPIIIPCHRILNKNGKLGGYRGGLDMKKNLLSLEKNNINNGKKVD